MFQKLIHYIAWTSFSFRFISVWKCDIAIVWAISYFASQLINIWLGFAFCLWLSSDAMNTCMNIFEIHLKIYSFVYKKEELISYIIILCWTSLGSTKLISTVAAPFCIPASSSIKVPIFMYFLNTCCFLFACILNYGYGGDHVLGSCGISIPM